MTDYRTHPSLLRLVAEVRLRGRCDPSWLDLYEDACDAAEVPFGMERRALLCRSFADAADEDVRVWQLIVACYFARFAGPEVGARIAAWRMWKGWHGDAYSVLHAGAYYVGRGEWSEGLSTYGTKSAACRALKRHCLAELDDLRGPDGEPLVRISAECVECRGRCRQPGTAIHYAASPTHPRPGGIKPSHLLPPEPVQALEIRIPANARRYVRAELPSGRLQHADSADGPWEYV